MHERPIGVFKPEYILVEESSTNQDHQLWPPVSKPRKKRNSKRQPRARRVAARLAPGAAAPIGDARSAVEHVGVDCEDAASDEAASDKELDCVEPDVVYYDDADFGDAGASGRDGDCDGSGDPDTSFQERSRARVHVARIHCQGLCFR
jgi:hypothetical protein